MAIQLAFWEPAAEACAPPPPTAAPLRPVARRPSPPTAARSAAAAASPVATPAAPASSAAAAPASSAVPKCPAAAGRPVGDERRQLLARLQQQVQQVQSGQRGDAASTAVISCGSEALDQLLPRRGLPAGVIAEWVAAGRGSGAGWLALIAARQALRAAAAGHAGRGSKLVVLDPAGTFYPPAAIAMGIPASSLVLVRPAQRADFLWVADQALRCEAVAAVWAPVAQWLDPRDARRLQLAAEVGQTLACWVRPAAVAGSPSFAEVRWHVSGVPVGRTSEGSGASGAVSPAAAAQAADAERWLRIELARCRGGTSGAAVTVRIDSRNGTIVKAEERDGHSTPAVHLAAQLAHPKVARPASDRSSSGRRAAERRSA